MVHFNNLALASILSSAATVLAAPAAAKPEDRAACVFSGTTGAALVAKQKIGCATITLSNVQVPAGTTLDLTGLKSGTVVTFEGVTTFGFKNWAGPLVSVSGTDITVNGAKGSYLDGAGAKYWDGEGSNGPTPKPKFFQAHSLTNSHIKDITIKNSPVQVFSIDGAKGLTLQGVTIDNSAGTALGHNTDGFDIGDSDGVHIIGAHVQNQDDCLAVNSGTDITFTGGTCIGGHGLSIGSVGGRSDNTVSGVVISSSSISDSQNGVRVKTVSKTTGSVHNVTYKDITLSNISKYGIVVEQDYLNGGPTGSPTAGVPITDLVIDGVHGSVASSATPVYILCATGACSGWTWEGVAITGGVKSRKCAGIPKGASC